MVSIGVITMPTDYGADPRDAARLLEDRGFESYFFPEHTHIPASRETPFPVGEPLPKAYWRNLDPLVVMGALAASTERLRLGTGVCLVAQRDPILTAKTLATLDRLSGGRIELGVGAGWNVDEMRDHGVPPERRWSVVREHVRAMQEIWAEDEASFHGDFVDFERVCSWPKPLQRARGRAGVPVLIGGDSRQTVSRIRGYGSGWIPALDGDVETLVARIREVESALVELGTEPPPITVAFGYRRPATAHELEALERAGVARVLLAVDALPYEETVAEIEAHARSVSPWLLET